MTRLAVRIQLARQRRSRRTRATTHGTAVRPRLSVFRSAKHFSLQLIDDRAKRTVLQANDRELPTRGKPVAVAQAVGQLLAERAIAKGISQVVFDRGAYLYHGRVKAAADGARQGGLNF